MDLLNFLSYSLHLLVPTLQKNPDHFELEILVAIKTGTRDMPENFTSGLHDCSITLKRAVLESFREYFMKMTRCKLEIFVNV